MVRYNAVAVSVSAGGTPKPDLMGKFRALFPEEKEQEISLLWEIVAAMTSDLRRPSASDKWRSTPQVRPRKIDIRTEEGQTREIFGT